MQVNIICRLRSLLCILKLWLTIFVLTMFWNGLRIRLFCSSFAADDIYVFFFLPDEEISNLIQVKVDSPARSHYVLLYCNSLGTIIFSRETGKTSKLCFFGAAIFKWEFKWYNILKLLFKDRSFPFVEDFGSDFTLQSIFYKRINK